MTMFLKNLAILGGLLFVAIHGAHAGRRWVFDVVHEFFLIKGADSKASFLLIPSLFFRGFGPECLDRLDGSRCGRNRIRSFLALASQLGAPMQRFRLGLFWFSSVQALQLSWMATTDYMGPLISSRLRGLVIWLGAQFGFLPGWSGHHNLSRFSAAPRWREYGLCSNGCGFIYVRLFLESCGIGLNDLFLSLQMASVFGIYGLSFWVVFVNLMGLRGSL